jgi:hypothetical protein
MGSHENGPATVERPGPRPTRLERADVSQSICTIEGCQKPLKTHGWCGMHYERWRRNGHTDALVIRDDVEARFWSKISKSGPGECWTWLGKIGKNGYAVFPINRKTHMAHRYAYELLIGPIADGYQVDHVRAWGCQSRSCCNPAHLEAVTPRENTMRSGGLAATNAGKVVCLRGHDDWRIRRNGTRACRRCDAESTARTRAVRRTAGDEGGS